MSTLIPNFCFIYKHC